MKKNIVEYLSFSPMVLNESSDESNGSLFVQGILQRKSKKNQNGRVYTDGVLEREVVKYQTLIQQRRAMGELDHPENSVVSLKNVSHIVTEMHWEGDDLIGTVEILPTPNGNIVKELIRSRVPIGISSRGLGTLNKVSENTSIVGDDFELIAFDFVSNPSTQGAFMSPMALNEGVEYVSTDRWSEASSLVGQLLEAIQGDEDGRRLISSR